VYQAAVFFARVTPKFLQIIFFILLLLFFTIPSMYDIPQLDHDTRFALWQVKTRAILTQDEVDNALDKFGDNDSKSWTVRL
jgi:hypothetical protein